MLETDGDLIVTKAIVSIVHDDLERFVDLLRNKDKKEFVILTTTKVVFLVLIEIPTRPRFVSETASAQGMTRFSRCYTPDKSEGKAKEFRGNMQPKDYSIVKHLEKNPT